MAHGASLAPDPHLLHPPAAADIVRRLLLAAHLLGILVNLLLCKNGLYLIIKNNMPNLIFLTQLILNTFNIFGSHSNFKYGNVKGKAYVF